MLDDNGNRNPSSFIPFCGFGNNTFFNNMTDYNSYLELPACDKFLPTFLDGRLCYKIDMDRFRKDDGFENEVNLLLDYNEDRMAEDIGSAEAMIYIETLGMLNT